MKIGHKAAAAGMVLLMAAVSARLAMGQAAPGATPPPTKLATIDIATLFSKLDEKNQLAQEVDTLTKQLDDEISKKKTTLQNQSDALSGPNAILKPGTPDYQARQEDLVKGTIELQVLQQMEERKVDMETRIRYAKLYKDVNDAIASYCKANGIALVFGTDDADLSGSRSKEELFSRVASRKVMYADPSFDITQAVVDKMNADNRMGHH